MKKLLFVIILLIVGIQAYGQGSEQKMLNNRGMFVLGHFLPGVEQTFTEKKTLLGVPLMAGAVGFGGFAIYEQLMIHNYKVKLDANPSDALFYEEKISKAIKGRNISLIGLGVVELVNIITLWTGRNSPVHLAYFPESNAIGVTYAFNF